MNVILAKTEGRHARSATLSPQRASGCRATGQVAEHRAGWRSKLRAAGLPHRRIEDWKYTDLRVLMRESAAAGAGAGCGRAEARWKPP